MRPPAGTVRGPVDEGVPDGGGVPGAVLSGRAVGARLVMELPGRDDTTRGAGDTGGVAETGATGGAVGVAEAAGAIVAGAVG